MRLMAVARERPLLVNDPQMLLDGVQARGCRSQHALHEVESFDELFQDFSRGQVFGHVLS
jgi:hypothetical protein